MLKNRPAQAPLTSTVRITRGQDTVLESSDPRALRAMLRLLVVHRLGHTLRAGSGWRNVTDANSSITTLACTR